MIMRALIIFLAIWTVELIAAVTGQMADILIYKGEQYSLLVNPLESFFDLNTDRRPKTEVVSTALWRGYVATFEIKDSLLVVRDIEIQQWSKDSTGSRITTWKSVIHDVFRDSTERFCNWFTGLLVLPQGEMISYVHMGYASLYEKYLILRIQRGLFNKAREFSGKEYLEFRKRQFEAYKQTNEFKGSLKQLSKEGRNSKEIEEFLFEYEIDYTTRFLLNEF